MSTPEPSDYLLDVTGLYCPEPVMMLHNKIRDMKTGESVQVIATDPATQRDIPKFCGFLGHQLLHQDEHEGCFRYWLRKADSVE